jgi:hypothetical protein
MFSRPSLTSYVAAIIIVMAIVAGIRWLIAGEAETTKMLIFFAGFLFGIIAKYIALHIYRDDLWPSLYCCPTLALISFNRTIVR